jgi:outer membrane protein
LGSSNKQEFQFRSSTIEEETMKKTLVAVSVSALAMVSTSALAMDVGAGMWSQSTSGSLLGGQADLDDNLGIDGTTNTYLYANIELPLPLIPDFKIRQQALTASGSGGDLATLAIGTEFADVDLGAFAGATDRVDTDLDLTYTDVVINWGLPVPTMDIDWGFNFRLMDLAFDLSDSDNVIPAQSGSFSLPIPMLHLAAEMDIPGLDVKVGAEYNTLPLDGAGVTDYTIKGMYYFPMAGLDLGIEAGYHSFKMEVGDEVFGTDTSGVASNITASGMFAGVRASF